MKTIGLIGGMSWESTVTYYKIVNTVMKEQLGGFHSAKCFLYSVDFQEIEECQVNGEWEKSGDILGEAAFNLEKAGADFIVICTNTMHKMVDRIQSRISIPILHIAEATADKLQENQINTVALLGTKYTMQQDFFKEKLYEKDIKVLIPCEEDIELINQTIYNELCLGIISEQSKKEFLRIMESLSENGAQGIILGCTEIGLLVDQADTSIPLFDTTYIHATKAAQLAIGNKDKEPIEEFDSQFCKVTYIARDNIVLLTWKKICCFEDYRKPTLYALEELRKHDGCNFVIDARNGFEDEKEDIVWGFSTLLPAMAETSCSKVVFIMDKINEIQDEMNMWTKEFMKYFSVKTVASYEEAADFIK